MVHKDVISWSAMIGGFARNNDGVEDLNQFKGMKRAGFTASQATIASVLRACSGLARIEVGRQIHVHVLKFDVDLILNNALLDMYCKSGSLEDAKLVFERLVYKNVISWSTMIGGFARNNDGHEALSQFKSMKRLGFTADQATLASVLRACTGLALLEVGKQVHVHVLKFDVDLILNSALLDMYCKSGSLEDAKLVFERIVYKNVISWNTMIRGFALNSEGLEALNQFKSMKRAGFTADQATLTNVLRACTGLAVLEVGRQVHVHVLKFDVDLVLNNALLDMYCKSNSLKDAKLVFERMVHKNVVSWNTMIGGFALNSDGIEALKLFKIMKRAGFTADQATLASVLRF
ncbi:SLOW GROWTH 2 [Hibiscus trionum]|uniref:SLOW GROWTH 2 n=1 Tax=Hibiscus trionum TaxID=183268 RepID=A0A9W7J5I0_HIBTR|nr:SLOW GROWTH 2 [Hibiscus trionum]